MVRLRTTVRVLRHLLTTCKRRSGVTTDIFGDLREWNRVIDQIELLKARGELDEHQEGLARLLRYRFNWRIREKAVQSLSTLSEPEERTVLLVLEIICDEHTAFDLRALAADALCGLIRLRRKRGQWSADLQRTTIERLSAAVNSHHPIAFQRAVKRVVDCAQQIERAAIGG
jgi:hypothetical protein